MKGFHVSIVIPIKLRDRDLSIHLYDHYIEDPDDPDEPEGLVFNYKVFDEGPEAPGEVLQLTPDERAQIYAAILEDLRTICQESK